MDYIINKCCDERCHHTSHPALTIEDGNERRYSLLPSMVDYLPRTTGETLVVRGRTLGRAMRGYRRARNATSRWAASLEGEYITRTVWGRSNVDPM